MITEDLPCGTVILEPQKILNSAIVGFDEVLIYDYEKLVDCFCEIFRDESDNLDEIYRMAAEWVDFNILCNSCLMEEIIIQNQ